MHLGVVFDTFDWNMRTFNLIFDQLRKRNNIFHVLPGLRCPSSRLSQIPYFYKWYILSSSWFPAHYSLFWHFPLSSLSKEFYEFDIFLKFKMFKCSWEVLNYEIWITQSGAMVFILNLDKFSLKKLFPTMYI